MPCQKTVSFLRPSLLALCVAAASSIAQAELLGLGYLPNGNSESYAVGVSGDGSVVVGNSRSAYDYDNPSNDSQVFRWTQASGMQGLGYLPGGGEHSWASAVSADGAVVVGSSDSTGHEEEAFRWTQADGMQALGYLPGSQEYGDSWASAVSADGSAVVGTSDSENGYQAFRWTQTGSMQGLGYLPGGSYFSEALGISADGLVVVGVSDSASSIEAFRWTQAGGMIGLGHLPGGGFQSWANAVSADGSVVVGGSDSASGIEAYRWTQAGGMQGLGYLGAGNFYSDSEALGISADGSVVVGTSDDEAFRWTQTSGMQSVSNWLQENGIDSSDWFLERANAVSADGTTIVGYGDHLGQMEAFVARARALVTLADLSNSLNTSAQAFGASQRSLSTAINGAHSRPLSRRVASGQSTGWLAGDWGKDEHGNHNGDIGLAEIGGGQNFGPVQVNLAIGQTWASQKQQGDSNTDSDGTYVLSEAILPISERYGLWATLGGYVAWGENDIKRGYQNGGRQDHSSASPDTQSYGLRARVDWEDAFQVGLLRVSPYTDLNYAHGKQDSYTEEDGGLPAQFDQQADSTTDLRLGFEGSYPLGQSGFNLVSLLEAAHRFEDSGASQSGQITGLFAFDLPGNDYDQDWQRLGLGVEGKLGVGKASLMLNGTTEGEMPSTWLAASYQLTF